MTKHEWSCLALAPDHDPNLEMRSRLRRGMQRTEGEYRTSNVQLRMFSRAGMEHRIVEKAEVGGCPAPDSSDVGADGCASVEPVASDYSRNSCRGSSGIYRWNSAQRGRDPESANIAFRSLDAHRHSGMALVLLVVFEWARLATEHRGGATTRSPRIVALEASLDMGAHCRSAWDHRYDCDGVRYSTFREPAARGICRTGRLRTLPDVHSGLRDCLH